MEIVFEGAIANFSGLSNQKFLEYLKDKNQEIEYYKLIPKPGTVYNAAFDWQAIGRTSSVLGIASFIWMAYTELIKPYKEPDSNGGIIIRIENGGQYNQFWIGNDTITEEDFMKKFQKAIHENQIESLENKNRIDSIRKSQRWERIK